MVRLAAHSRFAAKSGRPGDDASGTGTEVSDSDDGDERLPARADRVAEASTSQRQDSYDSPAVRAALKELQRECFLAWREAAALRHAQRASNAQAGPSSGVCPCGCLPRCRVPVSMASIMASCSESSCFITCTGRCTREVVGASDSPVFKNCQQAVFCTPLLLMRGSLGIGYWVHTYAALAAPVLQTPATQEAAEQVQLPDCTMRRSVDGISLPRAQVSQL